MATEPDHDKEISALEDVASLSQPSNALESLLASWPAKLCLKCASMTGTLEGLQALMSREGYLHFGRRELWESKDRGCVFCEVIFAIAADMWEDQWPWGRSHEYHSESSDYSESAEIPEASVKEDVDRRETKPMVTISCYEDRLFTPTHGVLKKVNLRQFKVSLRAEIIPASYDDSDRTKFYGYTNKYSSSFVVDGDTSTSHVLP